MGGRAFSLGAEEATVGGVHCSVMCYDVTLPSLHTHSRFYHLEGQGFCHLLMKLCCQILDRKLIILKDISNYKIGCFCAVAIICGDCFRKPSVAYT